MSTHITGSKIIKSFLWKFLERCSVQLTTFIVTVILARILTPAEFGTVAIILILINFANVIVEGGLTAALIQKKDSDDSDFSTIFVSSFTLSILVYLILYYCAPYIAKFYTNNDLINIIRVLAIVVIPSSINSIQKAYVSKHLLFNKMFISAFISIIISGLTGVYLAYQGYGVWALVIQSLTNQCLVTILMLFFIPWVPKFNFNIKRFTPLFDFGWKIFLSNFIVYVYEDIRGLLLGKLFTPSVLAYFDRGKQFPSLIMGNINTSIQTVLFPAFSSQQDNLLKVKQMMRKATQLSCYIVFPLLLLLFISAEQIVILLLTDKWLPAVPYIRIFTIALILMPLQSSNMIAIKSLGYSSITLKLEIIKKVIEAIILIISFQFNAYIVAYGVLVYNFICLFINLWPNRKILDYSISEQLKDITPYAIAAIIPACICYGLNWLTCKSIYIILLQISVGFIIYMFISLGLRLNAFYTLISILKRIRR